MHILLDSRDLIDLLEHKRPITAAKFDTYLRAGNHQIVLCFANVSELAGPIGAGVECARVEPFLQTLERMPLLYIKESTIIAIEIRTAVEAFTAGTEYPACSPYVASWDMTLGTSPIQDKAAPVNLGLRLSELVATISCLRPDVFAPPAEHHVEVIQTMFQNDRALLRGGKAPAKQNFIDSLKRHAASHRVPLPKGREDEFARWLYINPNRCPGLRLGHEVYRAILANEKDVPRAGDFFDWAYIYAIPYVDAATLDRRMRHYVASASRKMLRIGAAHNYSESVYEDVAALMQTHPNE
jgi:hypothetical protein